MAPDRKQFAVAPMMEWTDRHCRYFHRQLSAHARLYSEMVTDMAVIRGERERLIGFDPLEHPVALQLGGSDPKRLAQAAKIGEDFGYDEINLNVGCPSDRVQEGRFGACLMAEPALVGECVAAMRAAVRVPVTVKCRIGIDDQDSEAALDTFVAAISAAGCTTFIVHARKAWLKGLSPRENRDIPPLDYGRVHRLKQARPDLTVVINGGITSLAEARDHLAHVDGVMLGRVAYQNPALLLDVDREIYGDTRPRPSMEDVIEAMCAYAAREIGKGAKLSGITRHMLGLFQNVPGARAYRRHLSESAVLPGATEQVLRDAFALVRQAQTRFMSSAA